MKILLTAILTLLIFTGCNDKKEAQTTTSKVNKVVSTQKKIQGIILKDTTGKEIKVTKTENGFIFEGYENKVVLLSFFATWCPPCRAEIPHLNNLQEKYKKDLKIISVLLEENRSNEYVTDFMKNNDIKFTITNSDSNFQMAKEVGGVESIPFVLIYDRKGNYSQHYTGAIPEEMMETDIQRVL